MARTLKFIGINWSDQWTIKPTLEEVLEAQSINAYRAARIEVFKTHNNYQTQQFLNSLNLGEEDIIQTLDVAPLVTLKLTNEQIADCINNNVVDFMYYHENRESIPELSSARPVVIGSSDTSFVSNMGYGINVGIVENGAFPDASKNFYLGNTPIVKLGSQQTGYTSSDVAHATAVASIIAGSQGIAPKATLYATTMRNSATYKEAINLLVNQGVIVINVSAGFSGYTTGGYDELSVFTNYISYKHGIAIVKSSGNASDNHRVTSPGLAHNVITVSATNKTTLALWADSCYEENYGISEKPDIVAPGVQIGAGNKYEPDPSKQTLVTGTSFATPMVTGVIAVMMQKKPALMQNPHLVKSILAIGASVL